MMLCQQEDEERSEADQAADDGASPSGDWRPPVTAVGPHVLNGGCRRPVITRACMPDRSGRLALG